MVIHRHIVSVRLEPSLTYLQKVALDGDGATANSDGAVVLMDYHDEVLLRVVLEDADIVDQSVAGRRHHPLHRAQRDSLDHAVDTGHGSIFCINISDLLILSKLRISLELSKLLYRQI
jgi:hypothetical protein